MTNSTNSTNSTNPTNPTNPTSTTSSTTGASTSTEDEVELVHEDTPAPPGRPVRLVPTPPGFWGVLGGAIVAVLAPFFGILIGSTRGSEDVSERMVPIFWGFAIGCMIGALGMVAVILGARRLWLDAREKKVVEGP